MSTWTVHTSWRAVAGVPAAETPETREDWLSARRRALLNACLSGARYVALQGPGGVVVGEWDRYTNRWRDYPLPLGPCDNEHEPDGEVCGGEVLARLGDIQVKCSRCGAWHGAHSRPEWRA